MLAAMLGAFGRRLFRQDLERTLSRLAEASPAPSGQ
jgi:hypothetical protein